MRRPVPITAGAAPGREHSSSRRAGSIRTSRSPWRRDAATSRPSTMKETPPNIGTSRTSRPASAVLIRSTSCTAAIARALSQFGRCLKIAAAPGDRQGVADAVQDLTQRTTCSVTPRR